MKRSTWRTLASGLLAATLSLGIAACDDDTSSGTGDMSMNNDMAVPDMTVTGTPGNGQLTLADVVGTVYSATKGPLPRTHTLVAVASLPQVAGTPDPSSDFGVTPTIHGCSIYRYNATNLPGADGDAGDVTFSGFNTLYTIGFNTNGSASAGPMSGSSPITCKRSATDMLYHCAYNGALSPDSGEAGAQVSDVVYPVVPYKVVDNATRTTQLGTPPPPTWPGVAPYGDATCIKRFVWNPGDPNAPGSGTGLCTQTTFYTVPNTTDCITAVEVCEQSPIVPLGVSEIVENIAGGTDWPMAMQTIGNGGGLDGGTGQLAGPFYIVSVTSGTTDITGTDFLTGGRNLDIADGMIDATKDLTITFSCDPNNPTTAGAGCTGTQDLVGLLVTTSTSHKAQFSMTTAQGQGTCSQPVAAGSTISVKANQLTALLGGQTGGSWQIALVRLSAKLQSPAGNHPLLAFTAGMGVFGFTNQ